MRPGNTVNVAAVMLLLSVAQSTISNTRQSAMSNNTNSTPKAPKYLNKGAQAIDPNPIHPRAQPPSTDANSKIEARHSRMVDHLFQDWQRLLSDINMMIPQRCNAFQPARSMWSKLEQDFKNDVTWETKMLTAKEALHAVRHAIGRKQDCGEYSKEEKDYYPATQLWSFDLMATLLITTGMFWSTSPYHFVPSSLQETPKDILWDLLGDVGMDVRHDNWTTIWRDQPI